MKPQSYKLLLHPFFILSIVVLFINDVSLKYEFNNWFTGKLSDLAGVYALPIFLTALFPRYKRHSFILSALFFIWWKSELSSVFIAAMNTMLPVTIGRIIDYTDLIALAMLPLAWQLKIPSLYFSYNRVLANSLAIIILLVFCNTTLRREIYYAPRENENRVNLQYNTKKTETQILEKLEKLGIDFYLDSIRYYPVEGDYYQRISWSKDSIMWKPVYNNPDAALFIARKGYFYIIPQYVFEGDTLYNLEFTIKPNNFGYKRKTHVELESFQGPSPLFFINYNDGSVNKRLRKHFKQLLAK